jgi:hypothetical protein
MQRTRTIGSLALILVAGAVLVVGVMYVANRYISKKDAAKTSAAVTCQTANAPRTVLVQHSKMTPQHTTAHLCDKLTITSEDNTDRLIAFGEHDHHTPYDGVTEKLLLQGLTITLNQAGTFTFHDHLHDEVTGSFTVTK